MISKDIKSLVLVVLTLIGAHTSWGQQGALGLNISRQPAQITVGDIVTFTMVLSNRTDVFINTIELDATFSAPVEFESATNSVQNGTADLVGGAVIYDVPGLGIGQTATLGLKIVPVEAGFLTNYFDYRANGVTERTEEVVVQVYAADADLGTSLRSPTNTLVAGDWTTYRLSVTNRGPDRVEAVVVTTKWPAGTDFVSMTPNIPRDITGTEMTFTTAPLASGSNLFYDITIQPNTAGSGELTSKLFVANLLDRDLTNNAATNTLTIAAASPANLGLSFVTGQTFNPQTGLMEQTIRVTNNGTTNITATRVYLDNFAGEIYNASGTNNGVAFVTLTQPLAPSASVDLVLEYFVPSRTAVPNPTLTAFSVPQFVPGAPEGKGVRADAITRLEGGRMLIEFGADTGRRYSVIYSETPTFDNAIRALPTVSADGNRVQWIDAGPPKTGSLPGNSTNRFYRIIEITN